MKTKKCSKCENRRELSEFAINKATLDGLDYWCRDCRSSYHKNKYPRKMKKMYKDENSQQCRKCEEIKPLSEYKKVKGKPHTYCKDCANKLGFERNMLSYGFTVDTYLDMLDAQDGACYICKAEPSGVKRRLCVDHDHSCCSGSKTCGKCVRKLLCHQCNVALGAAKDNIEILEKMISYLKEHK